MSKRHHAIPKSFEVQPISPRDQTAKDPCTCGTCGLTWDDGKVTSMTPAPSARCPFEAYHINEPEPEPDPKDYKALYEDMSNRITHIARFTRSLDQDRYRFVHRIVEHMCRGYQSDGKTPLPKS